MVRFNDSLDKIVTSYFSAVSLEQIHYKGSIFAPQPLRISPLLLRGYTCPENCGACCPKFTLDYLPYEDLPNINLIERTCVINGKEKIILSDFQNDNNNHHCKYMDRNNARCLIHGKQPFSCDFELIRFLHFTQGYNIITQKLFGRGWNLTKYDGTKGALCKIVPQNKKSINEVIRKLKRLKQWCECFGINDRIQSLIDWSSYQLNKETIGGIINAQ